MAIVVIGGHSRSVGKTSVVAGLIAALRDFDWTAIKVTQYGHGICSAHGEPCDCAAGEHSWAISEERDRSGVSDTSRFLVAGAVRSLWARSEQGRLAEAMPAIRKRIADAGNVIIESNSIVKFLRPDLYLTVLDPATTDFKKSAKEFLDRADALILHDSREQHATELQAAQFAAEWKGISLKPLAARPIFRIHPPLYVTSEIAGFVRNSLVAPAEADSSRPDSGSK